MKKYIIIWMGIFTITSCSDFLDEEPMSEISQEQYFSSPEHAWAAVNQLYREGVQDLTEAGSAYIGPKLVCGSFMSGFFDNPKYKGQEQFLVQSQALTLNAQTSAGYLDGIWDPCYSAIAKANLAIKKIPTTPGLDEKIRKQLLAEAYFFRAFNYFYLVKYFGDVPLIIDIDDEKKDIPRTESKLVYDQIIKDLQYASDEGGLAELPMPQNGFRVSKGSVDTLLADVFLKMSGFPVQENKYAAAAATARKIINSGKYSLIPNLNNTDLSAYNRIRTSDVENEYMYQVEYKAGIASNFWMATYSFPTGAVSWTGNPFKYSITTEVFLPAPELLAIYDPAEDIRIQEKQFFHSSYNNNGTIETFAPMPYLWYEPNALFVTGQQDMDMKIYRYAEVLLIAAESIANAEGASAEAIGYLAQVRARASLTSKTTAEVAAQLTGLSKEQFIEEVWKERLREFPLEFKIWEDIQRTRKIMKTNVANKGVINFVNVIGATNNWGKVFQEKDYCFRSRPMKYNEIRIWFKTWAINFKLKIMKNQ